MAVRDERRRLNQDPLRGTVDEPAFVSEVRVNGYSGFMPLSFHKHAWELRGFPRPESLDYLRRVGVTHVVVDAERLSEPRLEVLEQALDLHLLAMEHGLRIYRLDKQPRP